MSLPFTSHLRDRSIALTLAALSVPAAWAQNNETGGIDEITVIGSPLAGGELDADQPYWVQTLEGEELQSGQYNSVADLLARRGAGVSLNHAQNNPLQPDLQVRGFTASPLLGAPQGVAVYLNGARINEPFGDTVNWDLLGEASLDRMHLITGANAAYGLNALGGTLVATTRTGFDEPATQINVRYGSFNRRELAFSSGGNDGHWGWAASVEGFAEEGWRDFSESRAGNAYGALSWRDEVREWDLFAFAGDSNLVGNGAIPAAMLEQDREAVFTHPDITGNQMAMLSSRFRQSLNRRDRITANIFARRNNTDSFNGDGSEFDECDPPSDGFLCEEDDGEPVEDQFGDPVPESFDAINNISEREQTSWGATLEYATPRQWGDVSHQQTWGLDYYWGETDFESAVELAQLRSDRSTTRSGLFAGEEATALNTELETIGLYWLDRFSLGKALSVTLSLRYNNSHIATRDMSGDKPDLNGDHRFRQLNGGIGFTYRLSPASDVYTHLHQSSRTPTPIELACSHPEAPCTLPNTFLADPPLDDIVARNFELGLRHNREALHWHLNGFYSRVGDDILFQSTGGVSSNEGFFANASDTTRAGVNALLGIETNHWHWTLRYSWLRARYEDNFLVSSPNHPAAVGGVIPVGAGDRLPGLPEHNAALALQWNVMPNVEWTWDVQYHAGVYLRGDEGNLDTRTDAVLTTNTSVQYRPLEALAIFLAVNNLFDRETESFGLYGEADEVLSALDNEGNRFLSPNEPRGAWLGLRYRWD